MKFTSIDRSFGRAARCGDCQAIYQPTSPKDRTTWTEQHGNMTGHTRFYWTDASYEEILYTPDTDAVQPPLPFEVA